MSYYSFIVPNEKEGLTPKIDFMIKQIGAVCQTKNTNNGVEYNLEFNSDNEVETFKSELEKTVPNLYK